MGKARFMLHRWWHFKEEKLIRVDNCLLERKAHFKYQWNYSSCIMHPKSLVVLNLDFRLM